MRINIDYMEEFEAELQQELDFIKEEFNILFGYRRDFNQKDRSLAFALLAQFSKKMEQIYFVDYFPQTLKELEEKYPQLFELSV